MGYVKERGSVDEWAEDVALKAKAASECEHGTILDNEDEDANVLAYKIGTNQWKEDSRGFTRQKLMDAIKEVIETAGVECYDCRKFGLD